MEAHALGVFTTITGSLLGDSRSPCDNSQNSKITMSPQKKPHPMSDFDSARKTSRRVRRIQEFQNFFFQFSELPCLNLQKLDRCQGP